MQIWKNRRCVRILKGHNDSVVGLTLVPGASNISIYNLISVGEDGKVLLWNEQVCECIVHV